MTRRSYKIKAARRAVFTQLALIRPVDRVTFYINGQTQQFPMIGLQPIKVSLNCASDFFGVFNSQEVANYLGVMCSLSGQP